jgi:gliding motility-associated-like protein
MSFSQVLGTAQTLSISPLPVSGTTYAVIIVPYNGYGCLDTLYAKLVDSLKVVANAGKDVLSCNKDPVLIGANSKPGLAYTWSPTSGLSNSQIANPLASPDVTTSYVLTASHDGGGCRSNDTVVVTASIIDDSVRLLGKAMFCTDSEDSAVLIVNQTEKIQWVKDGRLVPAGDKAIHRVTQTGAYYALLTNKDGCRATTDVQNILIEDPRPGITYPIQYAIIDLPLELKARKFGDSAIWSPGISLDRRNSYTPVFKGTVGQLYTIKITTKAGCVTLDTQEVKTIKNADIYVANAFSPNQDGKNDYLRPILRGIKEIHYFRVFNRWGQLLFESKNEFPGWDGRLAGALQNTQTVVWVVEGVGIDNRIYLRRGTAVLVR